MKKFLWISTSYFFLQNEEKIILLTVYIGISV